MSYTYSKLSTWRRCPRLYYEQYILHSLPPYISPAAQYGVDVHKRIEECLRKKKPLPIEVKVPKRLIKLLLKRDAEVEKEMAIDKEGKETEWYNAFIRGKIDAYAEYGSKRLLIDWKTGRTDYTDILQAKVYAALCGQDVKQVIFIYSYVTYNEHKLFTLNPRTCWGEVKKLAEQVDADNTWQPRHNQLCRFCPVECGEKK